MSKAKQLIALTYQAASHCAHTASPSLRRALSTTPEGQVAQFYKRFSQHPAANPPLFSWLEKEKVGFNSAQYDVFQRNFAARQAFTIPKTSKLLELLSRNSYHKSTAHVARTLAEEGGADKEGKFNPHSELLQNALFEIGERVFHLVHPNIRFIQQHLENVHNAHAILNHSKALKVSEQKSLKVLSANGIFDEDVFHGKSAHLTLEESHKALAAEKIMPETIQYTALSHELFRTHSVEKTLGVLTALEMYGEKMMAAFEGVAKRYNGPAYFTPQEYEDKVDIYFAVHRDGDQSLDHQHVHRMLEMIKEVTTDRGQIKQVFDYAEKFSTNQVALFHALHQTMKELGVAYPKVPFINGQDNAHVGKLAQESKVSHERN